MKHAKQPHILLYGTSPHGVGSESQLVREMAESLSHMGFSVSVLAVNDLGLWKDPTSYNYTLHGLNPMKTDPHIISGNSFLEVLHGSRDDVALPFDLVLLMQSPARVIHPTTYHKEGIVGYLRYLQKQAYMQASPSEWFKTVGIYLIDGTIGVNEVNSAIGITDQPISLTGYGLERTVTASPGAKAYMKVLAPPIASLPKKPSKHQIRTFKQQYFRGRVEDDTFLVTVVAKNHYLSDITRSLEIFSRFRRLHPNSFLYVHTSGSGPFVNILDQAVYFGLELHEDWTYPGIVSPVRDVAPETLALILTSSNVVLSTAQAQTYDYWVLMAMYLNTLVIAPQHTCYLDMLNVAADEVLDPETSHLSEARGIPLPLKDWTSYGVVDANQIRPQVDVARAVQALLWAAHHPKESLQLIARARAYAVSLASSKHHALWKSLIDLQLDRLADERADPHATLKQYFGS